MPAATRRRFGPVRLPPAGPLWPARRSHAAAVFTLLLLSCLASCVAACAKPLPEADSAGAKAYLARCSGCHALFRPALMTAEMWKTQVRLMEEGEFARRGLKLTDQERELIIEYLSAHAGVR